MHSAPPKKDNIKKPTTFSLAKRLIGAYVVPYKLSIFTAVIFMIMSAAMTALVAALMQPILDDVLYAKKEHLILPVCGAIAFCFATRGIATYLHTIIMNKIGHAIVADIQNALFDHFMRLELAFFHTNPSGQLLSRVISDVSVIRGAITNCMTGFGKSFFTLLFLIGLMFYRDWKLTLAAFIIFPLLSVFVIYISKRLRKISKHIQTEMGSLSDYLSQTFQGIRLVKAYVMEERESERAREAVNRVRDLNVKSVQVSTLSTPFNEIIVGMIFAGIIAYGGYGVVADNISPGQLASFLAAFTLAYEPIKRLAKLNNTLQVGLGAADRVFAMIDLPAKITDKHDAKDLSLTTSDVTFDNVDFTYEGSELKALNGISFTAKPGEVTALVGPSGGGKSTVMNLIPRFYDITGGAIKINGTNINDVTQRSLRSEIALVSQDTTIFNDSVYDNIRYGKPDATEEEVHKAAVAAAAHEFILGLEQGYDTIVGENGVKLSGGQKQRITIARAILRDAPILLLDEATSALDNESEKLVQTALKTLEKGRTTIVIAHRLSTIKKAHQILVLDKGQIVERGSHEELIQMGGLYADMYKTGMME